LRPTQALSPLEGTGKFRDNLTGLHSDIAEYSLLRISCLEGFVYPPNQLSFNIYLQSTKGKQLIFKRVYLYSDNSYSHDHAGTELSPRDQWLGVATRSRAAAVVPRAHHPAVPRWRGRQDGADSAVQEPGDHVRPAAGGRSGQQGLRRGISQNPYKFPRHPAPPPETGGMPPTLRSCSSTAICGNLQGVAGR